MVAGFAIHGTHGLLDFRCAVMGHDVAACVPIGLRILANFWHFVSGQSEQHVPTRSDIDCMVKCDAYGIFTGATQPCTITVERKHDPLRRIA